MAVIPAEDWLLAQNRVIGAALLDSSVIPRVVTDLQPDDFTGNARAIYDAMAKCFRSANRAEDITPVLISQTMGDSATARQILAQYMELSPMLADIDYYLQLAKQASKLNRLRSLGQSLAEATTLEDALAGADAISAQLVDRPGLKRFSPEDLMDGFALRHSQQQDFAAWSIKEINTHIRVKPGKFYIIGAEPSGGKTAFALEQLWSLSASKRVLFCSLETDEGTLFDRLISNLAGIPMDDLETGLLNGAQFRQMEAKSEEICNRNFQILPCAGLSVAGIKAAAINARAEIVIIDYLQLLQSSGRKQSRYEAITEISMDLHILAQSTGMTIIALSQVSRRDSAAKPAPLGIHSVRESGQIEADADAMIMLDKFVEKSLKESGCRANRVLRIVKNKNGKCGSIPLYFDGRVQKFSRVYIPNPDWEAQQTAKAQKKRDAEPQQQADDFEQLPMDTQVPF